MGSMGSAQFKLCNVPGRFLAQPHQNADQRVGHWNICGIIS